MPINFPILVARSILGDRSLDRPSMACSRMNRVWPLAVLLCLAVLFLVSPNQLYAEQTFQVSSADEVETLIESGKLSSGDTILWADGTYRDVELDIKDVDGVAGQPITLRAATLGGVVLKGESKFRVGTQHWVISGFHFSGNEEQPNAYNAFQFRDNGGEAAQHVKLTDCAFTNLKAEGETSKWIQIFGQFNTIDHCHFRGKNSKGALITVELGYLKADQVAGHQITRNYFGFISPHKGSDNEAIRLGSSHDQNKHAKCLVQENYGHHAHVEGNFFFGDGAENAGGIRVNDSHHVIVNNYLEGLTGTTWNAAFSIFGGNKTSGDDSNGYQVVENITVAHNTILNCRRSVLLSRKKGSNAPAGTFANNIVSSSSGPLVKADLSPKKLTWTGNLMHGAAIGAELDVLNQSPGLKRIDGLMRPDPAGPAANSAKKLDLKLSLDVDGQTRPKSGADIGADEVSGAIGELSSKPLKPDEIGARFLRDEAKSITDFESR